MEKSNRKKVTPDINEELMMNLMVDGVKKEVKHTELTSNKPVQREKKFNKKSLDRSYGDNFLKTHSMAKRGDKSIYIRQEYHERLSRIIQVIGKDEIPLYAYLDNILEHHFEQFEKAITEDFNQKFKPLF